MIAQKEYSEYKEYTEIELAEETTEISDLAFYDCDKLVYVHIPDTVTSIGYGAFYDCTSLIRLIIPNSVQSIGNNSFCGCTNLRSIVLSTNLSAIEESLFENCTSLTSIELPPNTKQINNNTFSGCASLSDIDFGYSLENIGDGAFSGCKFINISIPDTVKTIGNSAFSSCSSLQAINISCQATDIPNELCKNDTLLKEVFTTSIKKVGQSAFENCTNLRYICFSDSLESISTNAFKSCEKLEEIRFYGTRSQWKNVTKEEGWNDGLCSDMVVICDDDTTKFIYSNSNIEEITLFGELPYYEEFSNAVTIKLGSSIRSIGIRSLSNYTQLKEIYLTPFFEKIDCFALYKCNNLDTIYYSGTTEDWNNKVELVEKWNDFAALNKQRKITVKCNDGNIEYVNNTFYRTYIDETGLPIRETDIDDNGDNGTRIAPEIDGYNFEYFKESIDKTTCSFIYSKQTKIQVSQEDINYGSQNNLTSKYLYSFDGIAINGSELTDDDKLTAMKVLNNSIVKFGEISYTYKFYLIKDDENENVGYMQGIRIDRLNDIALFNNGYIDIKQYMTIGSGKNIQSIDCINRLEFTWSIDNSNVNITYDDNKTESISINDIKLLDHELVDNWLSTIYYIVNNNDIETTKEDLSNYMKYTTINQKEVITFKFDGWGDDTYIIRNKYE